MTTQIAAPAPDADIALAAALSVAVPDMIAGDAMDKAPGMIDHLRAIGFDVLPIADKAR